MKFAIVVQGQKRRKKKNGRVQELYLITLIMIMILEIVMDIQRDLYL